MTVTVLTRPGVPPTERLRQHFADQIARIGDSGVEFGSLLGTFANAGPAAGEQVQSVVLQGLDAWSAAVAATIQEGQEAGDIVADRPARELAVLLIDSHEGGLLRSRVTGDFQNVPSNMGILLASLRA